MSPANALNDAMARVGPRQSVQPCGPKLGAICILVTQADDPLQAIAQAQVSLQGPTPGQGLTDAMGVAEFACRVPGDYHFTVALPARLAEWRLQPHAKALTVSAGEVALGMASAAPVGQLALEIRTEMGELVDAPAQVTLTGPSAQQSRVDRGRHDYGEVTCGDYDISASVLGRFGGATASVSGLRVGTGARVLAQLVVASLTWIQFELMDEDGLAVEGEAFRVITADGREIRGLTDAQGLVHLKGLVPGTCQVSFPELDGRDWYRV